MTFGGQNLLTLPNTCDSCDVSQRCYGVSTHNSCTVSGLALEATSALASHVCRGGSLTQSLVCLNSSKLVMLISYW